jgi:hypothetical protein
LKFISDLIKPKTVAHKDLLKIIIISLVVLLLAVIFDVFDRFVHWYVKHPEPAEIEEIIIVIFVLSFAFAIFSWRRWRELSVEIEKRLQIEKELREERDKLQEALAKINTLSGLLPICSHCKKIRDDQGYWNKMEAYIHKHSEAKLSHGICPDCAEKYYPGYNIYDDLTDDSENGGQ